ncbi:MAG: hypothetical protein P4M14_00675 [Gammaproteobacteria bacterium]|nr:hypothetical protein [Gammaproteobacteria bacterium]
MRSSLSYPCLISEVREFNIPPRIALLKDLITLSEIKTYLAANAKMLTAELASLKKYLDQLSEPELEKSFTRFTLDDINEENAAKAHANHTSYIPLEVKDETIDQVKTAIATDKPLELKTLSDISIQLFFARYDIQLPEDLPDTIMLSASYWALKQNFYELVKNSFDADASKFYLHFHSDTIQVEIVVADKQKGLGFREGTFQQHFEKLSAIDYRTIMGERHAVTSSKTQRLSLGGRGKGLAIIDTVLQKHRGKLVLEHTAEHPAILRLISPVASITATPMSKYLHLNTSSPAASTSASSFASPASMATTATPTSGTPLSPMMLTSTSNSPLFSPSSGDSMLSSYLIDTPQSQHSSDSYLNSPPSTDASQRSLLSFFRRLTIDVVAEESEDLAAQHTPNRH